MPLISKNGNLQNHPLVLAHMQEMRLLREAMYYQKYEEETYHLKATGIADASGKFTKSFDIPGGSFWEVEVIAITSAGAAATADVYLNAIDLTQLRKVIVNAARYSDELAQPIRVDGNQSLIVDFNGVTVGAPVTIAIQACRYAYHPPRQLTDVPSEDAQQGTIGGGSHLP